MRGDFFLSQRFNCSIYQEATSQVFTFEWLQLGVLAVKAWLERYISHFSVLYVWS